MPTLKVCLLSWGMLAVVLGASSAQAVDLSGHWKGRWESCTTGHQGPLKAEFCRVDSGRYRVTFRGRFFKLLPFKYTVTLHVVEEGDTGDCTVRLRGSQCLGRKFGVFHYDATADSCCFHADYCSAEDRGVFRMRRQ